MCQVTRGRIHEVEHRGDRIAERIGRRQKIKATIESLDAPFERYAQTLTRIGRGHGLRVVVGYNSLKISSIINQAACKDVSL